MKAMRRALTLGALLLVLLTIPGCVSEEDEGWISGYGDSPRPDRSRGGRVDPDFGPRSVGRRR